MTNWTLISALILLSVVTTPNPAESAVTQSDSLSLTELSMELVKAVRDDKPVENITEKLANASPEELNKELSDESKKKAFWLNIYNAYVQILLGENPELFEDRNSWFGYNFFTSPQVTVAGKELSFDQIEHGIMRRSKIKISLGYLDQWFPDKFVKKFWWNSIDPRIHFALNCGAASCPPIAVYDPARVNEQLDITAKKYLENTTDYNPDSGVVTVNRLMSWFRADFGGKEGAIEMLKEYEVIPKDANPTIEFKEYDWTLDLGNYQDI